ncbi:MAG: right-handed parallel beta-helix repeat-containing protein [Candidatus Helarchaeota archaeon]
MKSNYVYFLRTYIFSLFFLIFVLDSSKLPAASPIAIPTFNCIGIYWSPSDGAKNKECEVRYRPLGYSQWKKALPLWFDERNSEYRGSIVNLSSGTLYEIQLTLVGTNTEEKFTAKTWDEDFPIAKTIILPEYSSQSLEIKQSGSPSGYILYTHAPEKSSIIDVNNDYEACIKITGDASYIIIRDVVLKGGIKYGIYITDNAHDIIIEQNDISNWGPQNGINEGAIQVTENVERIIVQRNKIHHPRYGANSWDSGHPKGPQAIFFINTKGNHVIRFNEVYSDFDHYFNDGIGGASNDSPKGFPHRDSDIYGNYIANCWDDGIEAEGGNENVRIWGNFIEHTFIRIAIAPTSIGPLYVWRNIGGASRFSHQSNNSDDYKRGPFFKTGGDTQWNKGRVYIFHNTDLNPPPPPGQTYPLGGSGGIISSGGRTYEHVSRNNIFTNYKSGTVYKDNTNSCTNNHDFNMYYGRYRNNCSDNPHEKNGIVIKDPKWWDYLDPNNGPGEFALRPDNPGIDAGEIIPNFNDVYSGIGPDIGAFEIGSAPMEFGVEAYKEKRNNDNLVLPPKNLKVIK